MSVEFNTLDEISSQECGPQIPIDTIYQGTFSTLNDAMAASRHPVSRVQRVEVTEQFSEVRTVARKFYGDWKLC